MTALKLDKRGSAMEDRGDDICMKYTKYSRCIEHDCLEIRVRGETVRNRRTLKYICE